MSITFIVAEPELPLGLPLQKDLSAELGEPCHCKGKTLDCHSCGDTGVAMRSEGFFKRLQTSRK